MCNHASPGPPHLAFLPAGLSGEKTVGKNTSQVGGSTVEVRSLHTLRLESLKLVFQPLHKFIVLASRLGHLLCA